jgi:hypothetical protein
MKTFAKELFAVFSLAVFLLAWALFLVTLSGCAGRRPRVYNDTCDLCITVPRPPRHGAPPPRPAPPAKPRIRPFYVLSFERPALDCNEVEHKPGTAVRLWACATDPAVQHGR